MLSMLSTEVHYCNYFYGNLCGMTYSAICNLCVDYVKSNHKDAVVVFDGYEGGPSTEDTAQLRRTGGCTSTSVKFT